MPLVNGPYRDPYDDDPPRQHKAPKALRRLRKQFTYAKQLEAFRSVFHREPQSDSELEMFAETYITERYNSGADNL
jgi:hypothetical protein